MRNFIKDNSTLIGVIITAIISGLVAYLVKRLNNKHHREVVKMNQILVPYMTCVEDTIAAVSSMYSISVVKIDNQYFNNWICKLRKPLEYLKAEKMVYLSRKSLVALQQYKSCLDQFESVLEKECDVCLMKYKRYVRKAIIDFPDIPSAMDVVFSVGDSTKVKLKHAIILKATISLINDFRAVDFVYREDVECRKVINISLDKKVRQLWEMINYGAVDFGDVSDPGGLLSCTLLDYIKENTINEKDVLEKIIMATTSADLLSDLIGRLKDKKGTLIKEISRIA